MTIDEQVKSADAKVAELEAALIVAQEHRRELVNRGNLNKCTHDFGYNPKDMCGQCVKCGVQRKWPSQ